MKLHIDTVRNNYAQDSLYKLLILPHVTRSRRYFLRSLASLSLELHSTILPLTRVPGVPRASHMNSLASWILLATWRTELVHSYVCIISTEPSTLAQPRVVLPVIYVLLRKRDTRVRRPLDCICCTLYLYLIIHYSVYTRQVSFTAWKRLWSCSIA